MDIKSKPKYISDGIQEMVPEFLQIFMIQLTEFLDNGSSLNIFKFKVENFKTQIVTHLTEQPKYEKVYYFPDLDSKLQYEGTCYIDIRETSVNLILEEEY